MLESLVIINSFFTDVYMEDIQDKKFHLHHIHLEQFLLKNPRKQ